MGPEKHGLRIVFWTWPAGCVVHHQSGGKGYPNDDAATSDAHKVIVDLELAMTHTEHALWVRHPRVKVRASRVPAGRFFSRMPPAIEPGSMQHGGAHRRAGAGCLTFTRECVPFNNAEI